MMQPGPYSRTPANNAETSLRAESLDVELSRLPTNIVTHIMHELGMHDKELQSLTLEEKTCIVTLARLQAPNFGPGRSGLIHDPMNNFPSYGSHAMANPDMNTSISPQMPSNTTSSEANGPRAPNMTGDIYAITNGLARVNLSGGGAGTLPTGGPPDASGQGFPNSSGSTQTSTTPPSPSLTSSSIDLSSSSPIINGVQMIHPATQPTSALPEVPTSFLSTEFMESVARALDDFDAQELFSPDEHINFEQDFAQWFREDLEMR